MIARVPLRIPFFHPLPGEPVKPIGIFAATRWEINAVLEALPSHDMRSVNGVQYWAGNCGDIPCWVVRTGIGPRKAEETARAILTVGPLSAIISTGFVCALNEARVGDVLIGTEIVRQSCTGYDPVYSCDLELTTEAIHAAQESGVEHAPGRFVSVEQVVCRGDQKRALAQSTAAIALDMESAALALVAREATLPFAAIRTVSDGRDEDLPLDFNLFLRPSGWIAGAMACLSHPSSFTGLSRLRAQSRIAAKQLSRFHQCYVGALAAARR
ncbi:5'-methylthioadenosine/S-adenosylhomocysteine nucleosidase family protein [Nitrospira sp. Nam80]